MNFYLGFEQSREEIEVEIGILIRLVSFFWDVGVVPVVPSHVEFQKQRNAEQFGMKKSVNLKLGRKISFAFFVFVEI